jgi:hypothetical protein
MADRCVRPKVAELVSWVWLAPVPYFAAWIAAMTGSLRTAAVEGAWLAVVHLAALAFLVPLPGIFFFFLLPVLFTAAGAALGHELADRHARLAPDEADRGWRRIHVIGAALAALYVASMPWLFTSDETLRLVPNGLPELLVVPSLTAPAYLPHALASWVKRRRTASRNADAGRSGAAGGSRHPS